MSRAVFLSPEPSLTVFPLDDAQEAFGLFMGGKRGKVVFEY